MLTQEEEKFISYWSVERLKKKKFLRKFSIGLPLGVMMVAGTLISLFSGWYKKADMALHMDTSVIIVVLIASIAIVVFITLFSAHHKWDQNELHYGELMARKERDSMQQQNENSSLNK
jgi:ATP/ADP translocase